MSIFSRNNYNIASSVGDQQQLKKRRLLLIGLIVLFVLFVIVLAVLAQPSASQRRQQKLNQTATTASQKRRSSTNWTATNTVEAGGYASSLVTQTGQSQNYIVIYKVDKTGAMTEIASGSSFTPMSLLELGIPLDTQAKLTQQSLSAVQQKLEQSCGYKGGDTPGIETNSFQSVQTDGVSTLGGGKMLSIQYVLGNAISTLNAAQSNADDKVVCVTAVPTNASGENDSSINLSFQLHFFTGNGVLTTHDFTYSSPSMMGAITMTLDGKQI